MADGTLKCSSMDGSWSAIAIRKVNLTEVDSNAVPGEDAGTTSGPAVGHTRPFVASNSPDTPVQSACQSLDQVDVDPAEVGRMPIPTR